jgi:hypothetical protein
MGGWCNQKSIFTLFKSQKTGKKENLSLFMGLNVGVILSK